MQAFIRALEDRLSPAEHVFFTQLTADMPRAVFVHTQLQFRYAVEHFVEPMIHLAERTPPGVSRQALLTNITDERGDGDPNATHGATFKDLLGRLGVSPRTIADTPARRPVTQFNSYLMRTAQEAPIEKALAVLGIIEHLFAQFSGWIGAAMVARTWLKAERVVHYATHQTLDLEHAAAFLAPLAAGFTPNGPVAAGLTEGAEAFLALYTGLYEDAR